MTPNGRTDGAGVELRASGGLVERVSALLAGGPLPTLRVAELALGLKGNPRAAAAAVFSLLGEDSRFAVDPSGVWALRPPLTVQQAAARLLEEEWVVVDVETTGGSPEHGHRVTEVAAVWVSGGAVGDTFSTLVNPERAIPGMITSLTGITNDMVRGAPRFHEVAPRLREALRGRVFVAHNAAFDWRFVSSELERCSGQKLAGRQLCTVRLARKLLPQLPSRSLDALALYFNLEIESRHRALDDAVATAHVLLRFLHLLQERGVDDWAAVEALFRARSPRRKRTASPRSMDQA